jgi:hypothetical protein
MNYDSLCGRIPIQFVLTLSKSMVDPGGHFEVTA